MNAGLVSISFRQHSPKELVRAVADCGLGGIEWGGDVHVPQGDIARAKEVGEITRNAGLEVASYGSYYRFEDCALKSVESGPSMQQVIETAAALEAPAIRIWAGKSGPETTKPEDWNTIVRHAGDFAEAAYLRGIRVDFEFHENTLTETADSTLRLLKDINHPNIRTLWQPPLQTAIDDRLEGLRKVKTFVTNVHCNHFGQNPWPDILALEEGREEWSLFLNELDPSSRDSWILIEHVKNHSLDQLRQDAQTLKSWLESPARED